MEDHDIKFKKVVNDTMENMQKCNQYEDQIA